MKEVRIEDLHDSARMVHMHRVRPRDNTIEFARWFALAKLHWKRRMPHRIDDYLFGFYTMPIYIISTSDSRLLFASPAYAIRCLPDPNRVKIFRAVIVLPCSQIESNGRVVLWRCCGEALDCKVWRTQHCGLHSVEVLWTDPMQSYTDLA